MEYKTREDGTLVYRPLFLEKAAGFDTGGIHVLWKIAAVYGIL